MMTLIFATQNHHKRDEVQAIAGGEIEIRSLTDLNFTEDLPETHNTLEGNALEKAKYVYDRFGMSCFSEDTGLEIEILNGEPGVFSARYAGSNRAASDNITLVLKKMDGQSNRRARFRTVICLIIEKAEYFFEGIINGEISKRRRGDSGFGYDPLFIPEGSGRSFAEMTAAEKNSLSHRRRAIEKMIIFLSERQSDQ